MNFTKWIESAKNGDHVAFRQLVRALETKVATTVVGMLGNCPEADDVGQEVFLRFYRALGKIRDPEKCEHFIVKIAINSSLTELKKRKRRFKFFQSNVQEEDFRQETDEIETQEKTEMVQKAIQKLETKFRAVVVLRMLDGYSVKETAEILRIPEGTVLSRLSRGQNKLRIILEPLMGGKW